MKRLAALLLCAVLLFTIPRLSLAETPAATEKAGVDLMLVVAHPGDEYLYLGGVLPFYCAEKGYTAMVVYLSSADEVQRAQAAAALKRMGVTTEPVFGDFSDVYSENMEDVERVWTLAAVQSFLTDTIRQYKPAVIATHDPNGEYGHGAHMLAAKQVYACVSRAASERYNKESAELYGTWQTQRVFYHLYGDEKFVVDRNAKLAAFSGKTAVEVETALYMSFSNQYRYNLDVGDKTYSVAKYGLAYSAPELEPLTKVNNFFFGLDPALLNGPGKKPTVAITASQIESGVAQSVETSQDQYFRNADDPEEVIVEDWENEHWEYKTDTLSIIIDRVHTTNINNQPVCYCVAQVRMRYEDAFRAGVRGDETSSKARVEKPTFMARRYKAVLAVTGDNLDVAEPEIKGIIMRNGVLFNNLSAADTAALYPDLSMRIFSPGETTYEQLLAEGVLNTFSFGPTLIRDGVVNSNAKRTMLGKVNPRTGIGMVEPGHFVVITVDGRQANYSRGLSIDAFMHLFYIYGCQQAYNLDGGNSTAMVFMGEHLNQHPGVPESKSGQRSLPDMLMWGYSEQVPSVDDPVLHDSTGEE